MERESFINSKVGFCSVAHPSWRGLLAFKFVQAYGFLVGFAGVYPSGSEVIKGYILSYLI